MVCFFRHQLALILSYLAIIHASFEPYELNGGLVSAVSGKGFSIIASDTRMIGEGGYLLNSRNHLSCRLWSVNDIASMNDVEDILRDNSKAKVINPLRTHEAPLMIGSAGCSADCAALQRALRADLRVASYLGQTTSSQPEKVATMLSQILYLRRGFPYYSFCVISGMDENGFGRAYVYDAIGSYEQVAVATAGTGRETLQPILDRLFECVSESKQVEGTADEAVKTLYDAYLSVSEREIGVGDRLVLLVSEKSSEGLFDCRTIVLPLKQH